MMPARSTAAERRVKPAAPRHLLVVLPGLEMGGAEKAVCRLITGLDRERIRSSVAVFREGGECRRILPPDVPVHLLGRHVGWGRARNVIRLARLVREQRVDVVFSVLNSANLLALCARVIGALRVPLVLGVRSDYRYGLRRGVRWRGLKRLMVRSLYPRADRILCVTDEVRNVLIRDFGVTARLCRTLGNVIGLAGAASPAFGMNGVPHEWLAGAFPVILGVGRLDPVKQFPLLLEAFRRVRDARGARLLILGDGPERGRLEDLVKALSLSEDCRLLGIVPEPMEFMRHAACLVVTSRSEGFPNVVAEAMVNELPVVAFPWSRTIVDLVGRSKGGHIVPRDNVPALARAIEDVLDDRAGMQRAPGGPTSAGSIALGAAPTDYEQEFLSVSGTR